MKTRIKKIVVKVNGDWTSRVIDGHEIIMKEPDTHLYKVTFSSKSLDVLKASVSMFKSYMDLSGFKIHKEVRGDDCKCTCMIEYLFNENMKRLNCDKVNEFKASFCSHYSRIKSQILKEDNYVAKASM